MAYLENWIAQLVLILLFAVILELLLPSGDFQKYVRFVVSLVLIVVLLNPVIQLFHLNPETLIQGFRTDQGSSQLNQASIQKKREIEKTQAAYIQEQMAVQLSDQVNDPLAERFGLRIIRIDLPVDSDAADPLKNGIQVTVGKGSKPSAKHSGSRSVAPVKPVSVQIGAVTSMVTPAPSRKADEIRSFLAQRWGIDKSLIGLRIEGGEKE
jgi:stage III sporulation protein AF